MRKVIGAGVFVLTVLLIILILIPQLPKYSAFLRIFFIFFLLDALFWLRLEAYTANRAKWVRIGFRVFHWLPFSLTVVAFGTGLLIPFQSWPVVVRTTTVTLLFILYLSKLPPFIAWLGHMMLFHGKKRSIKMASGSDHTNLTWLFSGWILGGIIFAALFYGMAAGQYQFAVKRVDIKLRDLPASFDGYRMVQISDVHLGSLSSKKYLQRVIDSVNAIQPDLVVFTGDMFNYRTEEGFDFEGLLKQIRATDGVLAILGNHDYGEYVSWENDALKKRNFELSLMWFQSIGWDLLRNEHRIIRRGEDSIAIIGVENWGATRRFQRLGDVEKSIAGIEQMKTMILLSHDPSHWDSIVSKSYPGIDLTLSGHTHGGQVGFDNALLRWSPSKIAYPHWMGLFEKSNGQTVHYLYVNPGIGTIGYNGRIGIEPEITVITLCKP
jgi:predicted MPP superfamily phosphohydrolase